MAVDNPRPSPRVARSAYSTLMATKFSPAEDAGDIEVSRTGPESRIARIEIENIGGVGDVGVENFEWTADPQFAPEDVSITIAYTRPNSDYSDTVINVNGEDLTCQPSTTDEFGCTVEVQVAPFSPVNFSVTDGGVVGAEGGFPSDGGGDDLSTPSRAAARSRRTCRRCPAQTRWSSTTAVRTVTTPASACICSRRTRPVRPGPISQPRESICPKASIRHPRRLLPHWAAAERGSAVQREPGPGGPVPDGARFHHPQG